MAASVRPDSGSDFAEAATDDATAVFHVSDEPREKIPKRDFMDVLDDAMLDEAAQTIIDHITG